MLAPPVRPVLSLQTILSSSTSVFTDSLNFLQFMAEKATLQTVG